MKVTLSDRDTCTNRDKNRLNDTERKREREHERQTKMTEKYIKQDELGKKQREKEDIIDSD